MKAISPNTAEQASFITERQARVHELFVRHRSMSTVSRILGVTQITVRETLVQFQRNRLRDQGVTPPSLKEMKRGDVMARFGMPRHELGGRPAKHRQVDAEIALASRQVAHPRSKERRWIDPPSCGVVRLIVTAAEPGATLHVGFWRNLRAYAAEMGAEIAVLRLTSSESIRAASHSTEISDFLQDHPIDVGGDVEIASDVRLRLSNSRPLSAVQGRAGPTWTVFRHPSIQFETLARIRADGLRVQMTTGAVTLRGGQSDLAHAREVGAVIVEIASDGIAHCRHILAPADGDGAFQDLTVRVSEGKVTRGVRVESLAFGDVHHAHIDHEVAARTWGIGSKTSRRGSLVDTLRPSIQVFHDVCDFAACSPFDTRDHHKRFVQQRTGDGDVRRELQRAVRFLQASRRRWSECVVVGSNHHARLQQWLREADFRDDPINAVFFLERSLALHRRLEKGADLADFFEETMRSLSPDGLNGVRFLRDGDSYKVAGVEVGIHGHRGLDGRPGGMLAFERLGLRITIGHTHRPTTRDGVYGTGVCQPELEYASGALTAWAVGHVVGYWNGSRAHLLMHGGRFHA